MKAQKTLEEKIIEKKTVKRNRPITYSFRVSERERRIIDEKVKTSGLSRTDFLIRALTDKPVVVFERTGEVLQELKRQGNNLNQISWSMPSTRLREENYISTTTNMQD